MKAHAEQLLGDIRDDVDEVRATVKQQLGAAAVPEWATETEELPRLAGGKPDIASIERWIAELRQTFRQTRP